mgnify:FL=1
MKLAAVVVFYNPSEKNIQNIKKYEKSIDRLFIVDNSEDKIMRYQDSEKIKYIKLCENKGIAHALNIGAKEAIKEGFNWLLTLDQDSQITKEIIEKLKIYLDTHDTKKIGLISPYQDIEGEEEIKDVEAEEMIEVMTSGNIINLKAYQKIGGFKDWLFIDCVDTDYCMNLHIHGYQVLRLNKVKMKHQLGNLKVHKLFGKKYPCYNHGPIRRYYIVRNNLYINEMYKEKYPDYCKHLLRIQKGQVKRILAFEKEKVKKLTMMYRGYKDFKKGIKGKCPYIN